MFPHYTPPHRAHLRASWWRPWRQQCAPDVLLWCVHDHAGRRTRKCVMARHAGLLHRVPVPMAGDRPARTRRRLRERQNISACASTRQDIASGEENSSRLARADYLLASTLGTGRAWDVSVFSSFYISGQEDFLAYVPPAYDADASLRLLSINSHSICQPTMATTYSPMQYAYLICPYAAFYCSDLKGRAHITFSLSSIRARL